MVGGYCTASAQGTRLAGSEGDRAGTDACEPGDKEAERRATTGTSTSWSGPPARAAPMTPGGEVGEGVGARRLRLHLRHRQGGPAPRGSWRWATAPD